MIVSNELLSKVLSVDVSDVGMNKGSNTLMYILSDKNHYGEEINIYELAHLCKEWAYEQGYSLSSGHRFEDNEWFCEYETSGEYSIRAEGSYSNLDAEYKVADTEPEAIFKACEWVLKRIEI